MTDQRVQFVLVRLLPLVAEQGWTLATLKQAGQATGETPQSLKRLFPNGITCAISAWQAWLDEQTVQRVRLQGWQSERIRDKVAQGAWTRLELIGEHHEAFQRATRQRLWHPRIVMQDLWRTADTLWTLAGDTAQDYNHYTKRLLLAKLLFKTTLSYLGDTSTGYTDTRTYLDTPDRTDRRQRSEIE